MHPIYAHEADLHRSLTIFAQTYLYLLRTLFDCYLLFSYAFTVLAVFAVYIQLIWHVAYLIILYCICR